MTVTQQLCKLAGYHELTGMICNQYFQGLPKGLWEAMIGFKLVKHYCTLNDWIDGAIRQHSKYLSYQSYFGSKKDTNQRFSNNQCPKTTVATRICKKPKCHGSYPWTYPCQGCPHRQWKGHIMPRREVFQMPKEGPHEPRLSRLN